jgi:alkylation response protein AidB-like acyl-CoA dehydrogenase
MMLQTASRANQDEILGLFRDQVRRFLDKEFAPYLAHWEEAGIVDKSFWRKAGEAGLLCPSVPEEYGGPALDFRFNAVVNEELSYAGSTDTVTLQSDITVGYIQHHASKEQMATWLPKMVSGEVITAIAMTEPGAGSDLQGIKTTARRDGNDYVLNGAKTYITNGQNADLIIVVAKTNPREGAKGISLVLVESDQPGFARGRNLDKIGQFSSDTSELFFSDVRVPITNLLGEENRGFVYLVNELVQERLSISISAQAAAQRAFDEAVKFTKERKAFGKTVFEFQNTRFNLADMAAKLQVGWAHLDWAINRHVNGLLTAAEASASKPPHLKRNGKS